MYYIVLALLTCGTALTAGSSVRPHIVFVLGDDVGWADTSFHGISQIPTPNMDALAADGVILDNYYVQPLCTPSRAALMSGVYPFKTGMQHDVIRGAEPWGLPLNLKIMPEYFRDLGYKTHMIGKWHLGYYKTGYTPLYRGFDSFYGFYNGRIDYYNHTLDVNGLHNGLDFWLNTTPLRSLGGNYSTNLYTERARHVITSHDKTKPLFLYMSHQAAHCGVLPTPLEAPEENTRKFPYIEEEDRTLFAGMMDALDQSVGAIFEYLSDAGMLHNTIFVYTTDNGGAPVGSDGGRGFNWPLRGTKGTLFEGGVKAGAFIWSPLIRRPRRLSKQMMHIVDWMVTLYSAAGGNPEDLEENDGINMWRQLSNDLPSNRREMVLNIDPIENTSSIRHADYKLVLGTTANGSTDGFFELPAGSRPKRDLDVLASESRAAKVLKRFHGAKRFSISPRWREKATVKCRNDTESNFVAASPPYLFNVKEDPCELNNLAATKPQLVRLLQNKLDEYARTLQEPLNSPADPRGLPDYHHGLWATWED